MKDAIDRLLDLAGRIHVSGYERRSTTGNMVHVNSYWRSPSEMTETEIKDELESLTGASLADVRSQNRRRALRWELNRRATTRENDRFGMRPEAWRNKGNARDIDEGPKPAPLPNNAGSTRAQEELRRRVDQIFTRHLAATGNNPLMHAAPDTRKGFKDWWDNRTKDTPETEQTKGFNKGWAVAEDPLGENRPGELGAKKPKGDPGSKTSRSLLGELQANEAEAMRPRLLSKNKPDEPTVINRLRDFLEGKAEYNKKVKGGLGDTGVGRLMSKMPEETRTQAMARLTKMTLDELRVEAKKALDSGDVVYGGRVSAAWQIVAEIDAQRRTAEKLRKRGPSGLPRSAQ